MASGGLISPTDSVTELDSSFSNVVFDHISKRYLVGESVSCRYRVTHHITPTNRDWIGLYKVPWSNVSEQVYYEWAPLPDRPKEATGPYSGTIVFPAGRMPGEDDEYYQFCYVTNSGQVQGASVPFQFVSAERMGTATGEDFVAEDVGWDDDILVITPKVESLDLKIREMEKEKEELQKSLDEIKQEKLAVVRRLEDERLRNTNLDIETKGLRMRLDELGKLHRRLEVTEEDRRIQLESKKDEIEELASENETLAAQSEMQLAKITSLKNSVDELTGALTSEQMKLELYSTSSAVNQQSADQYLVEIAQLKAQVESTTATLLSSQMTEELLQDQVRDLVKYKDESSRLQQEVDGLLKVVEGKDMGLEAARETVAGVSSKLEGLRSDNFDLQSALQSRTAAMDEMARNFEDAQEKLKEAEKRKNGLWSDVHYLNGKIDEGNNQVAELQAQLAEKEMAYASSIATATESAAAAATEAAAKQRPMGEDATKAFKSAFIQLKEDKKRVEEELKKCRTREGALRASNERLSLEMRLRDDKLSRGKKEYGKVVQKNRKLEDDLRKELRSNARLHPLDMSSKACSEASSSYPGRTTDKQGGTELTKNEKQALLTASRIAAQEGRIDDTAAARFGGGMGVEELRLSDMEMDRSPPSPVVDVIPPVVPPRQFTIRYPYPDPPPPLSDLYGSPPPLVSSTTDEASPPPQYSANQINDEMSLSVELASDSASSPHGSSHMSSSSSDSQRSQIIDSEMMQPRNLQEPIEPVRQDMGDLTLGGTDNDDDRFHDAVNDSVSLMNCCVCAMLFDPRWSEEERTAHVNSHDLDEPEVTVKSCPMCLLKFPETTDDEAFAEHVNSHFD